VVPTNLYLLAWRFVDLSRHAYPYYLEKDEANAFAWLEKNANQDDVVLSSITIGQFIPASTGLNAFLAHWAQTLDFYKKSDLVNAFFDEKSAPELRSQMLEQYGIDFVFYGPAEQKLGGFNPGMWSELQIQFSSPLVKIYKVPRP